MDGDRQLASGSNYQQIQKQLMSLDSLLDDFSEKSLLEIKDVISRNAVQICDITQAGLQRLLQVIESKSGKLFEDGKSVQLAVMDETANITEVKKSLQRLFATQVLNQVRAYIIEKITQRNSNTLFSKTRFLQKLQAYAEAGDINKIKDLFRDIRFPSTKRSFQKLIDKLLWLDDDVLLEALQEKVFVVPLVAKVTQLLPEGIISVEKNEQHWNFAVQALQKISNYLYIKENEPLHSTTLRAKRTFLNTTLLQWVNRNSLEKNPIYAEKKFAESIYKEFYTLVEQLNLIDPIILKLAYANFNVACIDYLLTKIKNYLEKKCDEANSKTFVEKYKIFKRLIINAHSNQPECFNKLIHKEMRRVSDSGSHEFKEFLVELKEYGDKRLGARLRIFSQAHPIERLAIRRLGIVVSEITSYLFRKSKENSSTYPAKRKFIYDLHLCTLRQNANGAAGNGAAQAAAALPTTATSCLGFLKDRDGLFKGSHEFLGMLNELAQFEEAELQEALSKLRFSFVNVPTVNEDSGVHDDEDASLDSFDSVDDDAEELTTPEGFTSPVHNQ